MKHLLLSLLLLTACNSFAQVETAVWNGKTYFVYPYQQELEESYFDIFSLIAESKEELKRDEKNRKVIETTVVPIEDDRRKDFFPNNKKGRKSLAMLTQALSDYPEMYYYYSNSLENDLTPATEQLPDGEYIQYYRDLPYLDNKVLRYKNDVVAGVFTIRNNRLEGNARWISASGKILKEGSYVNGARNGKWSVYNYEPKEQDQSGWEDKNLAEIYALIAYDTLSESTDYAMGLLHGNYTKAFNTTVLISGQHKNDKPFGPWENREFRVDEKDGRMIQTDELVLRSRFTYADADNLPIGKSVIIREEIIPYQFMYDYDTSVHLMTEYGESPFGSFSDYYEIVSFSKAEETFELPEEDSGEEEEDSEYDEGYSYYEDFASRNDLIDSVGYRFYYTDVYEEYYPNGQLKIRFEVKDGTLVSEDTIFWDNGRAANVVNILPDSSGYEQLFFDYDGDLYLQRLYDNAGNELNEESAYEYDETVTINNRQYRYNDQYASYIYDNKFAIRSPLTERVLLEQKLWRMDSSISLERWFDPVSRTYDVSIDAISKKPAFREQAVFDEEYKIVNAFQDNYVGDLRLHSQFNGSTESEYPYLYGYEYYPVSDSIPPYYFVDNWSYLFSLERDDVLFLKDRPFSGDFKLGMQQKNYALKTKSNAISVQLPANEFDQVWKARYKYWRRGKWSPVLDVIQPGGTGEDCYDNVMPLLPFMLDYVSRNNYRYQEYDQYRYYENYDDGANNKRERQRVYKKTPRGKTITGRYLDGKPDGLWTIKDQFGQPTLELNFFAGELNGTEISYETILAPSKKMQKVARFYGYEPDPLTEPEPTEDVRYVSRIIHYKNGMLNGPATMFNWQGDTTAYLFFKDGSQQGHTFQRNSFAYSSSNYEDGVLDGLSRTWLTLPGRDSLLLFDLNFQNGMLQGESKSYHTNGKLAKHGFFLTGEPIDDYEAYDTLGFRYQYVKFLYSQPVEEKIWEENQLSVRYEFDWKDSIPFDISDIAGSTSIDGLLIDLGLAGREYLEPYYGRPSLVDKTGITYTMTKYYPNDTVARHGKIVKGKKTDRWEYFSYEGKPLYTVDYADTVIVVNDSVKFKSKGVLTYSDEKGNPASRSYLIEKFEKYDCSHTDHYEERMLYTFWEKDTSVHRINGYVKNYYDNGALQNEGLLVNGLPSGIWKLYDSYGHLSHVGEYVLGKRQGRWLSGDLGEVKYMGDICLNPNLPNLEEIMSYQEKVLDITVSYYKMGTVLKTEFYGVNMNTEEDPSGGEEYYYDR